MNTMMNGKTSKREKPRPEPKWRPDAQAARPGDPALPFPVVDIETTGLDPDRHSIVSIGAVWPGRRQPFYVECRPWKGAEIDLKALQVNGERVEALRARPLSEGQAVVRFLTWLDGPAILGGMNPASLDLRMLRAAIGRMRGWLCHRSVDMHSLAVAHALRVGVEVPERGFPTDAIYGLVGMDPEPKPHHAMRGARMEAAAFDELIFDGTGGEPVPDPGEGWRLVDTAAESRARGDEYWHPQGGGWIQSAAEPEIPFSDGLIYRRREPEHGGNQ